GDGRKVLGRVKRHLGKEPGVDGVRGHRRDADRGAIRRGLGHQVHAQIAASAGLVLDDHRAQAVLDALGQGACGHIDRATGGIRHDDADRLALRPYWRGKREGGGTKKGDGDAPPSPAFLSQETVKAVLAYILQNSREIRRGLPQKDAQPCRH
ncbi:MAG: hypothetical protein RI904_805, partial [Pseudomonadota bacterium]